MHSFTYSIYISWVLAKVLQCTSPTCPFFFLPTRPLPCPWEDPPVNPPSSDPSSLLARLHSDPPASYSACHNTSLHRKAQLSPTACQTQYPQAAGLTLLPLVTDWFPYTFPPILHCNHTHPQVPRALTLCWERQTFSFCCLYFFNVPFHL